VSFYILGQSLGLVGTVHGLVIMNLTVTLPIMTWVLMGVFASLPVEVERAARVDGCSRLQALRLVVFPMALPGITAVGLLTFLLVYNEFLFSWILVQGTPAQTLQPTLASMWFMIGELNIMAAANSLGLIVPIAIAIIFQRYITQLRIVDPVSVALG
jgi:multiple sugar transport system permease protein